MALGQSMKVLNHNNTIGKNKEESVEELLSKLAKKGKKVKLLDESASVRELPKQEDNDEDLERDEGGMDGDGPGSVMKDKINKIKDSRIEESEKKAKEQQEEQRRIIDQTNQQL